MKTAATSPSNTEAITYVPHCWVTMSDGVRLSASLWRPPAAAGRVPLILEIHPYRKRDLYYERDHQMCSFFAERGTAYMRVDMRGHGDSEGLHDAYRTYQDVEELLAWARLQDWCSGDLGMMGISWGGTNSFMAANRQALGLKAILTNASSHDRYGVGMLWKNGCLLNENFGWVTSVSSFATRPPDPEVVGAQWREQWLERLERHEPELRHLFMHQRRNAYWDQHHAESLAAAPVAMYMTAGLADNNYAQTPPTLLPRLSAEAAMLLGPWGHKYPHQARPGPAIDFLTEAGNWFDRHLKGKANQPAPKPFTIFLAEDTPASADYPEAKGRWVSLPCLPPSDGRKHVFALSRGRLDRSHTGPAELLKHRSPLDTGSASGELMPWFAFGPGPELPSDQRVDDGKSLCFDSESLTKPLEYIGAPSLTVQFSVDKPVATLVVRLCDVKPDGTSTRVSLGVFNLNQVKELGGTDREPRKLEPGKTYTATLALDFAGYRFLAGHRVRLALSTSYWPIVWPSPEQVEITVHTAGCQLALPMHMPENEIEPPKFGEPMNRTGPRKTVEKPALERRSVRQDIGSGVSELEIQLSNGPFYLHDLDWSVASKCNEVYRIDSSDPHSAQVEIAWEWRFKRGDWSATTRVQSKLTSDASHFYATLQVDAFEREEQIFSRTWNNTVVRDHI